MTNIHLMTPSFLRDNWIFFPLQWIFAGMFSWIGKYYLHVSEVLPVKSVVITKGICEFLRTYNVLPCRHFLGENCIRKKRQGKKILKLNEILTINVIQSCKVAFCFNLQGIFFCSPLKLDWIRNKVWWHTISCRRFRHLRQARN